MKNLEKYLSILLALFIAEKADGQSRIDLEGIKSPPLAFYLASDSTRYLSELRYMPNKVDFRKMIVYYSVYDLGTRKIDTISKPRIQRVFVFIPDSNLLVDTFYHQSAIPSTEDGKYYFNSSGKITERIYFKTENNLITTVSSKLFSYDEFGHVIDTLIFKYDSYGRLIQSKPYAGTLPWTTYFYKSSKDSLPYLKATPNDSTYFYYEGSLLKKQIEIRHFYFKNILGSGLVTELITKEFSYNKNGLLSDEITYDSEYKQNCIHKKYLYNEKGFLTAISYYYLNTEILFTKISFEYNKYDLLTREEKICFPKENDPSVSIDFFYDEKNNVVKIDIQSRRYRSSDGDNWSYKDSRSIYLFGYEY